MTPTPRTLGTASHFGDSRGMTVAEVIIALGIITVGLLALIGAMPLSTSQLAESNLKTTAAFLAQQRLERVKNAQWTWTPVADTLGGLGADGTAAVAQWADEAYGTIGVNCAANDLSGSCGFRRQVRIADCSIVSCSGIAVGAAGADSLRQIAVTVFFRPKVGTGMTSATEESVTLVTLVAKR